MSPADGQGSLRRGLSRDAAVYATGDVAAKALGFVSVPVYTRVFAPEVFSAITFLTTVGALLAALLSLGGDTVLSRFWFRHETAAGTRSLVATWVGFLGLLSSLVIAVLLPFSGPLSKELLGSSDGRTAVALLLLVVPVSLVSRMLGQVLRVQFRAVAYAATSFTVAAGGLTTGLVLAVALDAGLAGVFGGLLCSELAVLGLRLWLCRAQLGGRPDPSQLPELLRFGVPLVPVTLSFFVFTASDRLVVGRLAGLEELAPYAVAVSLASVVALFCSAVGQAWVPRATQLYERDPDAAAIAFGQALVWYVVVLGGLAVTVSASAPLLFALVAPADYASGARLLPLLALGAVAYGSQLFTSGGLTMTQRTSRLAGISVAAACVNLAVSLTLVPVLGPAGAGISNVVGFGLLTVGYFVASQRAWPIIVAPRAVLVPVLAVAAGTVPFALPWDAPVLVRLAALPVFALVVLGGASEQRAQLVGRLRSGGRLRAPR